MMCSHSAYSYTFTQGRNNMHAQKNMNVYDVYKLKLYVSCRKMKKKHIIYVFPKGGHKKKLLH